MSFIDSCLSWNNVTIEKIIILIIMVIIGTICIFYTNFEGSESINFSHMCIKECNSDLCQRLTQLRDGGYSLNSKQQPYNCIFTMWELSHVLFHVFLGYFFNIYIAIGLSVFFELYEHYVHNCASILDLFWNTIGLLIGVGIRHFTCKQQN